MSQESALVEGFPSEFPSDGDAPKSNKRPREEGEAITPENIAKKGKKQASQNPGTQSVKHSEAKRIGRCRRRKKPTEVVGPDTSEETRARLRDDLITSIKQKKTLSIL